MLTINKTQGYKIFNSIDMKLTLRRRTLYQLLPTPNVLVAVSKGLWIVKHCPNKILQSSTGDAIVTQAFLYNDNKMAVVVTENKLLMGIKYIVIQFCNILTKSIKSNVTLIWVVKPQPCIKLNRLIR